MTLPQPLLEPLSGRYAIERELGRGGMATVYLARDRKHGREVALKVLRPDLAASIGAERFLKEIEIAARLTHPHILGLHDSGDVDGLLFYVMPYIVGGSLRQKLERAGRLGLEDAVDISSRVADALTYAHRMGVLHRDIKPENILFAEGHPIVGDFGIAKAISTAGGAHLTRTGFPLGTPGYMSPEQAAGLTDLDERTDVYSLAVVIYEMLTGQIPGRWLTEGAVRAERMTDATLEHRRVLDSLPSHVERALVRGLAIRLDQRTPSPSGLIGELTTVRSRRRYNEEQVRGLVKRAAEMEVSEPTTIDGALTLGAVERIASEVGIDPKKVRAAAAISDGVPTRTPNPLISKLIGGPTFIVVERYIEGEVPDAEFPMLIDEVRTFIGESGLVGTLGRSVTWTGSGGKRRPLQVTISVRAGRTRIHIRDNLTELKGGVFGGLGGGLGGGGLGPLIAAATDGMRSPGAVVVLIPLWLIAVWSGARSIYHYSSKGRQRQCEELADRLAALSREVAVVSRALPREAGVE